MMLVTLLGAAIVLGLVVYLVSILPLPPPWRTVAMVLVILLAIVVLLQFLPRLGVELP